MLTKEAWNAFLKTLEEPPPNTVFVLATTEPQKVMATIVDRCQRFDFQRPSLEQIAEVVRRVADGRGDRGRRRRRRADRALGHRAASATRSARSTSSSPSAATKVATDDVARGARRRRRRAALRRHRRDRRRRRRGRRSRPSTASPARAATPASSPRDLVAHLRQLLVARATGEVPESFTVTVAQPERLAEQAGAHRRGRS